MNADSNLYEFALDAAQEWLDTLDITDPDETSLRDEAAAFITSELARVAEIIRTGLAEETDRIIADTLAGNIA